MDTEPGARSLTHRSAWRSIVEVNLFERPRWQQEVVEFGHVFDIVDDRQFVIYGDKGINSVVPKDFWETTKDAIVNQFKKGNFKQGLIDGILRAGKELQEHFPWNEGDKNELSDKISK